MKYVQYGRADRETIILLHGGGLSWWNFREAAQALADDYHVILPILDGHAGSDADFTGIGENAERIIGWIDACCEGQVLLIGGLSLGGQVLLEMLARRRDLCRFALIESAMVIPSRLTHAMIAPAFGSCHGLIRHRWFSRLQFSSLRLAPALFEDYYRDTCAITKQNMIAFLQANALYDLRPDAAAGCGRAAVFVGERENRAMRESARRIHAAFPGSTLKTLPGLHHGEFSINHGEAYARAVRETIAGG